MRYKLTETRARVWARAPKEHGPRSKLADGGGLYLVRLPSGTCTWQARYRLDGRQRTFTFGEYGDVSLDEAREQHQHVRQAVAHGRDPMQLRKLARAAELVASGHLVSEVTAAWLAKERAEWSEDHHDRSQAALEKHVLPSLGKLPVRGVTPAMVSAVIERIQKKAGRETAAKLLRQVRGIFRYAAAQGMRNDNPADPAVEVLQKAPPVVHRPAVLTLEGARETLAGILALPMSPAVRMCHALVAHTAVRIGNAVSARWEEFDLEAGYWVIPRAKMKMKDRTHDHRVPLNPTILAALRRYKELAGGDQPAFLFPGGGRRDHLTREAIEKPLRQSTLAGKHSIHGWRASFSTLAKEAGFDGEVVDLALDHVHDSEVARAYDRGERFEKRVALMHWWGSMLAG